MTDATIEAIQLAHRAITRQILANGRFTDEEKAARDALGRVIDAYFDNKPMTDEQIGDWQIQYNAYTR